MRRTLKLSPQRWRERRKRFSYQAGGEITNLIPIRTKRSSTLKDNLINSAVNLGFIYFLLRRYGGYIGRGQTNELCYSNGVD